MANGEVAGLGLATGDGEDAARGLITGDGEGWTAIGLAIGDGDGKVLTGLGTAGSTTGEAVDIGFGVVTSIGVEILTVGGDGTRAEVEGEAVVGCSGML